MEPEIKEEDRRVVKTIAALRVAMVELIIEKHYDSITVQDIIDRANVGRSTFYTHFRDKEDLLVGDWKKFLGLVAAYISIDPDLGVQLAPIEGLMMHLRDYHSLYRGLVRSGKAERLFTLGVEFLSEAISARIMEQMDSVFEADIAASYLATNIFGMLKWWLDRNMPETPAQMADIFERLVAPGFYYVVTGRQSIPRTV